MPDERQNGKDIISLRDLMEARLYAFEKELALFRESVDVRMHSNNEWRQQSKDQSGEYLRRVEYQVAHEHIIDDIKSLQSFRDQQTGKASANSVVIASLLAVAGICLALAGLLLDIIRH
jgi:hypothetical protein